jgi:hypothetical protein
MASHLLTRVAGKGISDSRVAAERGVARAHLHLTINLMKLIHFFLVKKSLLRKKTRFFPKSFWKNLLFMVLIPIEPELEPEPEP